MNSLVTSRLGACLFVCLLAAAPTRAADRPFVVASQGDAFIAHQAGSDRWSIGSANLELVVGFDANRSLTFQRLFSPSTGRAWEIAQAPAFTITAGTERVTLTSSGAVTLVSAIPETTEHGVTLTFTFEHRAQRLLFTRVLSCYPGSPTIESWARIVSSGGDGTTLSDLVAWDMTMPLGNVRWLGGLRGDSAKIGRAHV